MCVLLQAFTTQRPPSWKADLFTSWIKWAPRCLFTHRESYLTQHDLCPVQLQTWDLLCWCLHCPIPSFFSPFLTKLFKWRECHYNKLAKLQVLLNVDQRKLWPTVWLCGFAKLFVIVCWIVCFGKPLNQVFVWLPAFVPARFFAEMANIGLIPLNLERRNGKKL